MPSTAPLQFSFTGTDQEMICGPDSISSIGKVVDRLGAARAMVVCGPTIYAKSDVVQRVQEALGERCAGLFSGVMPHSPVEVLDEAVAMATDLAPDVIISAGGGSTSDTCKGIAILLAEGGSILDYQIRFEPPDRIFVPDTPHQKIPIIAVPTTMGGAEISSGGGGITSKELGRKISTPGKGVTPKAIIIDGRALATTPMDILLSTAIGQFRIAVESLYSTGHQPVADALALHTIKMLVEYLPQCPEGDINCLLQTKTAAVMVMLVRPGLGLTTAIAHHVGGLYDVAHGEANGILLPHAMRFNLEASADRQALIAQAMGINTSNMSDEDAGFAAADAVDNLCRSLGLPATLRDVGVPEEGLELIAAATLHDRGLATNPVPVYDAGPIMNVLRQAW